MAEQITYTPAEDEMLEVFACLRIDGASKDSALSLLFSMGYKVTPNVVNAINKFSKHIFFGA